MRITDVKVVEAPLTPHMSNAVIDFSRMTVSLVAVHTDAVVDGEPVVGYGFSSNGRYAQTGILTERLLPRLHAADPADLRQSETGVLDPVAVRHVVMADEKPGGHGDRAVAVGTLDMAMWDAASKAQGKPLHEMLRDRFRPDAVLPDSVWVYAAGGYYRQEDDDLRALQQGGCESYPYVFEPFGGFADETPVEEGRVALPDAPGIGIEHKSALRKLIDERLR
ncbi:MAG: hypothetical protein GEU93_15600 [Propionibacteriales bacterium]|nr:hypothetical protein [Propionibacteriales bacterium]